MIVKVSEITELVKLMNKLGMLQSEMDLLKAEFINKKENLAGLKLALNKETQFIAEVKKDINDKSKEIKKIKSRILKINTKFSSNNIKIDIE